jgi:hypothetical protein
MLKRARENCKKFGAASACLLHVDELDSLAPASFDLVHSYTVFQHIHVARGELILRRLIDLIAEGGVGAIHLTCYAHQSALRRGVQALRQRVLLVHRLLNLAQGRPFARPQMQMNSYSMNRIFDILFDAHCSNLHVDLSDHRNSQSVMLYFEKPPTPRPLCRATV